MVLAQTREWDFFKSTWKHQQEWCVSSFYLCQHDNIHILVSSRYMMFIYEDDVQPNRPLAVDRHTHAYIHLLDTRNRRHLVKHFLNLCRKYSNCFKRTAREWSPALWALFGLNTWENPPQSLFLPVIKSSFDLFQTPFKHKLSDSAGEPLQERGDLGKQKDWTVAPLPPPTLPSYNHGYSKASVTRFTLSFRMAGSTKAPPESVAHVWEKLLTSCNTRKV